MQQMQLLSDESDWLRLLFSRSEELAKRLLTLRNSSGDKNKCSSMWAAHTMNEQNKLVSLLGKKTIQSNRSLE